jgi:hypothetical protein
MTPAQVVMLVVAILVPQALLWVLVYRWVKAKSARLAVELQAELAASGEVVVRGPSLGLYRGGSGKWPKVKGNGVMVLTERRVIFRKLIGAAIEVPSDQVTGVRDDKWFLRAWTGGRLHLILELEGGDEVGYFVADHPGWMATVRERVKAPSPG